MENQNNNQQSLLDEINAYEPNHILNIADVEFFDLSEMIETQTFNKGETDEYKSKILYREDKKYRIPFLVLGQIKKLREVKPNLTRFQVIKSGSGKEGTKYQTIPYIL